MASASYETGIIHRDTTGLAPIVQLRGITKLFPGGVVALDRVDLDIYPGTIHALLGENGAGKSTLVKILYGVYSPDEGEIIVEGERKIFTEPMDAIRSGIVMVSQSPQLIDILRITENIVIGLDRIEINGAAKKIWLWTRSSIVEKLVRETADRLGMKLDPYIEAWKLSYTQKQMVEILRALILNAKVLILDEAITFLPIEEKRRFYTFIKRFAAEGGAVILITHKIEEAMEIADKITVLRRGKVIGTLDKAEATIDTIRQMMFGERSRLITHKRLPRGRPSDEKALEIKNLWVKGDFGAYAVKNAEITVRRGEVYGIAGVAGNGQKELIQTIIGLRRAEKGTIRIYGLDVTNKGVAAIRRLGVGYIPDIPFKYGISPENTIEENIAMLPVIASGIIDWERIRRIAEKLIEEYKIVAPSTKTPVKLLSGGNIMKVLVSRELLVAKKLLVAYNPTRGLDEASAMQVRRIIKQKVIENNIAAIIASEDLDEILQISDTIAVMNSGEIKGVFDAEKVEREKIEELMVM